MSRMRFCVLAPLSILDLHKETDVAYELNTNNYLYADAYMM